MLFVGLRNRQTGTNSVNEHSSRSHSMLTLHIDSEYTDPEDDNLYVTKHGKLTFVDLAGRRARDKSLLGSRLLTIYLRPPPPSPYVVGMTLVLLKFTTGSFSSFETGIANVSNSRLKRILCIIREIVNIVLKKNLFSILWHILMRNTNWPLNKHIYNLH